jgi:4-amino-4-deoxychorismate lyase
MCLLFETIRIEDGQPLHLQWHERRMNRAGMELWGMSPGPSLRHALKVPSAFMKGRIKCRVIYERDIREIRFACYEPRRVRSLRLVDIPSIDYHLKYHDRSALDGLFEMRGECDDVIIVAGGMITDTSFSNLVFSDGNKWYTPEHPILEGTCRARLIAERKIFPLAIRPADLDKYLGCGLINAMRDLPETEMIERNAIF